jgi:SpoVK/Ycf46/Vps4 family AAA+-type ATPase
VNLIDYIRSDRFFTWLDTHEEERAVSILAEAISKEVCLSVFTWDLIAGMRVVHLTDAVQTPPDAEELAAVTDPVAAINQLMALPVGSVVFFKDFHKFTKSIEVIRTMKNIEAARSASGRCVFMVALSPVLALPPELEKDCAVINFELPSIDILRQEAEKLLSENGLAIDLPEDVVVAAKGMTLKEARWAFSMSLIKTAPKTALDKAMVEKEKMQVVKKSGLMEICETVDESQLGGLEPLKSYIDQRKIGFTDERYPTPKGILFVGLPGAGKSLSVKVVASKLGLPLVRLDVSSLKSKYVGDSEGRMRRALTLIDAISPCLVWLDEIEKSIGGAISSDRVDGGTTSAMFGQLLTWMQESDAKHYIVATCNDIRPLLEISQGALLRRFDDVFFLDLPSAEERRQILEIHNAKYGSEIPEELMGKPTENWTGAEIEKLCKTSLFEGNKAAYASIRPIFIQNKAKIQDTRKWAKDNARLANKPDAPLVVKAKKQKRRLGNLLIKQNTEEEEEVGESHDERKDSDS